MLRWLLCLTPSLLNKPIERFPNDFIRKSLLERQPAQVHRLQRALGFQPWITSQLGHHRRRARPPLWQCIGGTFPALMFYAGHQFGQFNPALGDGRAILIGELVDGEGARFDIQLKGSGPTQHSRGGDGLSPLGPVIREYLMSEFMFYAGVPTSRSLAAISTGDPVYRERSEPGGVLTRVSSSHIRFGTFQYFAARGDDEALQHWLIM